MIYDGDGVGLLDGGNIGKRIVRLPWGDAA